MATTERDDRPPNYCSSQRACVGEGFLSPSRHESPLPSQLLVVVVKRPPTLNLLLSEALTTGSLALGPGKTLNCRPIPLWSIFSPPSLSHTSFLFPPRVPQPLLLFSSQHTTGNPSTTTTLSQPLPPTSLGNQYLLPLNCSQSHEFSLRSRVLFERGELSRPLVSSPFFFFFRAQPCSPRSLQAPLSRAASNTGRAINQTT